MCGPAPTGQGAGGGGGATAAGGNGSSSIGGNGGAGAPNTILGPDTTYAGGGGGGAEPVGGAGTDNTRGGSGGAGGGGDGLSNYHPPYALSGTNGTANTGGGAGGVRYLYPTPFSPLPAGGSGIVVVRGPSAVTFAGSPCCAFTGSTHPGGDKIAKFTASGTLTIS